MKYLVIINVYFKNKLLWLLLLKKDFSSFIADEKCLEYEEDVDVGELYGTAPLHPVQIMRDYNNGYD